jgi:hypothetical protein
VCRPRDQRLPWESRWWLEPRAFALEHSWRACTQQFLANVAEEPEV